VAAAGKRHKSINSVQNFRNQAVGGVEIIPANEFPDLVNAKAMRSLCFLRLLPLVSDEEQNFSLDIYYFNVMIDMVRYDSVLYSGYTYVITTKKLFHVGDVAENTGLNYDLKGFYESPMDSTELADQRPAETALAKRC
jgi:hypothetical protein